MEMKLDIGVDNIVLLDCLWGGKLYGLAIVKPSGELIHINETLNELFETNNRGAINNLWEILPENIKNDAYSIFKSITNHKSGTNQCQVSFKNANDEEKFIIIKYFYLTEQELILIHVEDHTLQKQAEIAIKDAQEKIEESDRIKAAFLANISHEIRTPMNGIIGFSGMLLDPDITDEKRKQFVEIIVASSNQLIELIDKIIDLSKIEAQNVEINKRDFYLNNLLDEVYTYFSLTAASKNIKFNLLPGLPHPQSKIFADENKLKQILFNILSNAFKFTHNGTVEMSYNISGNEILFLIRDTGIGIDSKNHKSIFERFRQADDSRTREYGGTGLGLSISKSYIELLGGRIWVQSKLNDGASFYFTIPYLPVEIPQQIQDQFKQGILPDWSGKTILVAEDEDINYIYITEVLSGTNVNIILARNGLDAVEIARNNPDISLILMDIKMPELNGYEATKIIKQFRPNLPIIAQTAYAMAGDRETALAEGCDDYLSKPVKKDKLLSIIQNYI